MADILEFRPADSKRPDDDQHSGTRGPAEVVMFPGVRYEHWPETSDGEADQSATMRRRDVIELAE